MPLRQFLFQSGEGYADTASPTADWTELGYIKLNGAGIGGYSVDAGNSRIINVAEPTNATDAATRNYVDTMSSGLAVKQPARVMSTADVVIATAPAAIDGVTLVNGDRVLLVGQTLPAQNGIYQFNGAGAAMTRTTDANSSATLLSGSYVFVQEGNVHADSAWVLVTDAPITVGTTDLTWVQFSGLGQVVAGLGLVSTGNQIDVGKGDGIAIDSSSISIDLDVNPALALNGTTPNKKLAWLPDANRGLGKDAVGAFVKIPAANSGLLFDGSGNLDVKVDANGGLLKDSLGLGIKIGSVQELTKDGAGLHVVGLPTGFRIGGVAVGPTVDSANLDTLTNGSNADSLHSHTAAIEVPNVKEIWTANGAVAKGDGVYISANGAVSKGDCSLDSKSKIIGVAETAIADASAGKIIVTGTLTNALSGAVFGDRYFLSTTGQPDLIANLPARSRTIQLGFAKNATDLTIRIFDFGKKA